MISYKIHIHHTVHTHIMHYACRHTDELGLADEGLLPDSRRHRNSIASVLFADELVEEETTWTSTGIWTAPSALDNKKSFKEPFRCAI